jgi:hypothetical protein
MTILTVSCFFTLVTLLSAESSSCDEKNERREASAPMCQTIFLESNGRKWAASSHPNAADPAPLRALEANVISVARTRAFAGPVSLERRKKLLESSLLNWIFYEDLSDEQRAVLDRASFNCAESPTETATGAILFDRFSASQRATFVAITHAMMNTSIVDAKGRDETVDALGLVCGGNDSCARRKSKFAERSAISALRTPDARCLAALARGEKLRDWGEPCLSSRLSIFVPAGAAVCSKRPRSWFAHLNRQGWSVRGDSYRLPILDPASVARKFGRESAGQSREAR